MWEPIVRIGKSVLYRQAYLDGLAVQKQSWCNDNHCPTKDLVKVLVSMKLKTKPHCASLISRPFTGNTASGLNTREGVICFLNTVLTAKPELPMIGFHA